MIKAGKVWGETTEIFKNSMVELHRIEIKPNYRCSKHFHAHKWNGFYVEKGLLEIHVVKDSYNLTDVTVLESGDFMMVPPGETHWFQSKGHDVVAFELYWPELLTDDIIREDTGQETND